MKKNNKRFIRHEQWIEIEQEDGRTVTTCYPPNDEFEQLRLKMDPPPEFQLYGGLFLQRITV